MKILAVVILSAVAVLGAGCSSKDVVKDSDRVVVEYNRQMWGQVAVVASAVGGSAPQEAALLAQLAADGNAAANHMVTIWGPPAVAPPPYNRENLLTAIKLSSSAHASIWLHPIAIAGYAAMALLAGLKIAGSFIPGVGTFVSSASGVVLQKLAGAMVELKHQADSASDDKLHVSDIQEKVDELSETPHIGALLKKAHVDLLLGSTISETPPATPVG